jgi:hypothetical protein
MGLSHSPFVVYGLVFNAMDETHEGHMWVCGIRNEANKT